MKLTINSKVLKYALDSANKAIDTKASLPILANFLLRSEGEYLAVIGGSETTTIKESIPCITEGEAVLSVTLLELVRTLPDGDVTIETDNTTAKVLWANGNSIIPAFDPKDYPAVSTSSKEEYIKIDGDTLSKALAHTIPHTDNDELRPVMNGVYFNARNGDTIEFVASDSHTLGLYPVSLENGGKFDFVCPVNSLKLVANALKSGDVELTSDESNIYFRTNTTTIVTRKIVGKFPDYTRIIPKQFNSNLIAKKSELISAIRRILVCANKASGHIKLSLGMLECSIEAQDTSYGISAREVMEGVTYDGADLTIGFKGDYLLRCLTAIEGSEIKINFTGHNKAAIVTSNEDKGIFLIMPVMI